ncbi:MAG: hypothetical protein HYZ72_00725 [Deltaproteobacteria bacterium]|nr:hypothetical protein [Deltaproteobacteria bacterium]
MFMTEVLRRCSGLEQRVADIYSQFAGSLNDDKALESFWLGMAEEEKHHSKILAAERAALEVDSDTGYFMPEFPAKLVEMDTLLKRVEEKARLGVTRDEAFALALELEQSELNTIYRDLVLMGRAAVKLMARHMDQSLSLPKHKQDLLEGAVKLLRLIPLVLLAACIEQRALERFDATINRLCVAGRAEHTVDQHLSTHPQGCVLLAIEKPLAAGLSEAGLGPGVYRTQATSLGFTQYLDEVIVARYADTLAVMTPAAFHELAQAAGAVHEARLEERQLREGLGLVILGNLQTFAPAEPQQLTPDELVLLRKGL